MGLEGTVNLPGMGAVKKKYVAVAAGGIAAFVLFMYWRASHAGTTAADPTATDYATEPAYEDGYSSTAGLSSSTTPSGSVITNNVQWANAAVQALIDLGVDPLVAAAAIGAFLARMELTSAQADLVRQALALVGDPPVGTWVVRVGTAPPDSGDEDDGTTTPPGSDGGGSVVPPATSGSAGTGELWDGVPPPPQGRVGQYGYAFPMHSTPETVHHWFENDGENLKNAQPVGNRIGDTSAAPISGPPGLLTSQRYKDAQKQGPGYVKPGSFLARIFTKK
jgi:hypothetical protein